MYIYIYIYIYIHIVYSIVYVYVYIYIYVTICFHSYSCITLYYESYVLLDYYIVIISISVVGPTKGRRAPCASGRTGRPPRVCLFLARSLC